MRMKRLIRLFVDFFKSQYNANPQILWIPIFILLWVISVPLLRLADPTAAIFDAGIFQIPIYATIIFFISMFIAWQTIRILYRTLYDYLKTGYKSDFKNLSGCQKIIISLSVFFLLLFALITLMGVL